MSSNCHEKFLLEENWVHTFVTSICQTSKNVLGSTEKISLTPHYHFHRLHRHLDINRAITAESSPLHISSSQTGTWKLWLPNASRYPLSSASPCFHEIAILRHDKISKGILGLVNCCGFNSVNTKNNVI